MKWKWKKKCELSDKSKGEKIFFCEYSISHGLHALENFNCLLSELNVKKEKTCLWVAFSTLMDFFIYLSPSTDPASVLVHVINGEHPAAMQHGNSSSNSLHTYNYRHRNRNSNFLTFHLSKWLLSSPTKMFSSIPTLLFVAFSTVICINFSMRWFMLSNICNVMAVEKKDRKKC